MEQKETRKLKRPLWAVYILLRTNQSTPIHIMKKRVKRSLPHDNTQHREYVYLDIVKLYNQHGIVHIVSDKKEQHTHEMAHIESIQVREYDRSGRVQ
jgi:tRNA(Ile2) C34 agmatinyltransferase TiaS